MVTWYTGQMIKMKYGNLYFASTLKTSLPTKFDETNGQDFINQIPINGRHTTINHAL